MLCERREVSQLRGRSLTSLNSQLEYTRLLRAHRQCIRTVTCLPHHNGLYWKISKNRMRDMQLNSLSFGPGGWSRLLGKNLPRMSKKGFWISAEEKGGTGRSLKVARSAAHIQASQTLTRRHKAAGNERTDDGSNTPAGSPVEK